MKLLGSWVVIQTASKTPPILSGPNWCLQGSTCDCHIKHSPLVSYLWRKTIKIVWKYWKAEDKGRSILANYTKRRTPDYPIPVFGCSVQFDLQVHRSSFSLTGYVSSAPPCCIPFSLFSQDLLIESRKLLRN